MHEKCSKKQQKGKNQKTETTEKLTLPWKSNAKQVRNKEPMSPGSVIPSTTKILFGFSSSSNDWLGKETEATTISDRPVFATNACWIYIKYYNYFLHEIYNNKYIIIMLKSIIFWKKKHTQKTSNELDWDL